MQQQQTQNFRELFQATHETNPIRFGTQTTKKNQQPEFGAQETRKEAHTAQEPIVQAKPHVIRQGFKREVTSQQKSGGGDGGAVHPAHHHPHHEHPHHHRHHRHPEPYSYRQPPRDQIDDIFAEIGIHLPRVDTAAVIRPDFANIAQQKKARRDVAVSPSEGTTEATTEDEGTFGQVQPASPNVETAGANMATEAQFPATIQQRRQQKLAARQTTTGQQVKRACRGCPIEFWNFMDSDHSLCHNCVKIVDAVRRQASRNKGTVEIVQVDASAVVIRVTCQHGHQWANQFRPKQGQRWCKQCRRNQVAEHKAQIRAQEEVERNRITDEQEQMFEQAQAQFAVNQQIDAQARQRPAMDPNVQFIQRVVDAIVMQGGQQPVFRHAGAIINPDDQDIQHRLVEAILEVADIDAVVNGIFDAVGERQQHRVERRIKFMVHPDKNTHRRAKDAFQLLSNSTWRRKKSSSRKPSIATIYAHASIHHYVRQSNTTTRNTAPKSESELPMQESVEAIFAQWLPWCLLRALLQIQQSAIAENVNLPATCSANPLQLPQPLVSAEVY